MDLRSEILDRALEHGFDLAGIAPFGPPPDAERFETWLVAGRHGSMGWLERGRRATVDPRSAWPEGRSLLVVAAGHSRSELRLEDGTRVARYAAGRDYHNWFGRRLRKLRRSLAEDGLAAPSRAFVDATPLLERSHAAAGGLGFASKAANLLHPRFGPWMFLGELILDADLEPTPTPPAGSCGTCTACIDACPTGAIVGPGEIDARLCISHATIEQRGPVDEPMRTGVDDWLFGCDVCSEVCPWGSKAPDLSGRLGTRPEFESGGAAASAADVLALEADDDQHAARWAGSPLRRPRRTGLARNAALVLGNRPREGGAVALRRALEHDPDATVRATAFWALVRGHARDAGVRHTLDR
ncbi:MAG: tRNA epoxyqueuosine(34) reductase QueG, partial [Planctomycetota bacterium]